MNAPSLQGVPAPAAAGAPVRWGMVFDMDRCIGCQTCTIACKQTNQTTPGVLWRNVLDFESGEFPAVDRSFLLTGCQHCDAPPCVPVCPTGATWKREDGLVVIDYDVCIGCSSCVVACPYQARTLEKLERTYFGDAPMPTERRREQTERRGVAQKCTFCKDRVDAGLARGLRPGTDPDATPACANACISSAITFGNLADASDRVSQLLAAQGGRRLHEDLGTNPHIFYLGERQPTPRRPGPVQKQWDWRAAMNFVAGGAASGLFIVATLASLLGAMSPAALRGFALAAATLMAVGLLCVFLKLGRKARFWRVATRWQSSWMTRETYCVAVVFAGVALLLAGGGLLSIAIVGAGAAGFLYCQARILHAAKGIPAWRDARVPSLLVLTGLLEGVGLYLVGAAFADLAPPVLRIVGLAGALLCLVLAVRWAAWVRAVREDTAGKLDPLVAPVLLFGHALPACLFLLVATLPQSDVAQVLAALGGLLAAGAGAAWKYVTIVRAAHFQGTGLPSPAAPVHRRSPATVAVAG